MNRIQTAPERSLVIARKAGIRGQFRTVLRDGVSGKVKYDSGWFDNMITTQGLENMGGRGATAHWANRVVIGDGTTPPTWGDTSLESGWAGAGLASTGSGSPIEDYGWSDPVPWLSFTNYARFGTGTSGTVSEVGVACITSGTDGGGYLSARQLLSPAFVKGTGDILDVWYKAFWYFDTTPATGTVVLDGQTYNWTATLGGLSGSWQGGTWGCAFFNPKHWRNEDPIVYDSSANNTSDDTSSAPGNSPTTNDRWNESYSYLGLNCTTPNNDVRNVYNYCFMCRIGVLITFEHATTGDAVPFTDKDVMSVRFRLYYDRYTPDIFAYTQTYALTGVDINTSVA